MLNATKSFHLGFGISDHFVRGVEFSGIDNSDLRGLSATLNLLYVVDPWLIWDL